jgi:Dolichyl-phosphate-mannose-protein mannosyltransferase
MRRVPRAALAGGAACALLACVPTASYAEWFAHPARVAKLGGAIPDATVHGAAAFRVALAAGAVLIPLLTATLIAMCGAPRNRSRWLWPLTQRGWLVLAVITGAGAVVRMALATESLWYDEISAFLSFAIEGPGVAFGSYVVPTNHVPMTLATWASWRITGGSLNELVLRAPALIAGIASIPAGYALAASLFPRRVAWLGALAVSAAPIAALESAEARGYAFVILAALVAALAHARAMRTRAASAYIAFACACAFGAWAHPVAILVPIAAGLIGLVRDRKLAVAALLSGTIAAILLAPLSGDVLATKRDYLQSAAEQPTVFSREGYEALLVPTLSWSGSWLSWPNLAMTLVVAAGLASIVRRARVRTALLPFALALVLAAACSMALGTWIYARFVLFALPIGVLAVVAAGTGVGRRLAVTAALVMLGLAIGLHGHWVKQPIRDAVAIVAVKRAPGDRVATIGLPDNAVGFYAQQFGFDATPTGFLGKDLAAVVARESPRFVVVLYPDRVDDEILQSLDVRYDRTHALEGWADWGAGAVEVWERAD